MRLITYTWIFGAAYLFILMTAWRAAKGQHLFDALPVGEEMLAIALYAAVAAMISWGMPKLIDRYAHLI